jgi:phytoene synthase
MESYEISSPQNLLMNNSKSFHWASRVFSSPMRQKVEGLYAFCRVLDDMADGKIPNGHERLISIREDLIENRNSTDPIFSHFQPYMHSMNFRRDVLFALMDGLIEDSTGHICLAEEADLLVYAYRVAGTVGLLMCEVLNCKNPASFSYAIDLGIGMQLTNIARDVLEDATMGRRYIPGEWLNNLSPDEIRFAATKPEGEAAQDVRASIKRLLALAETYYKSGASGYRYLPWRAHLSIALAARIYRQIGLQLADRGFPWHEGRQVTSKAVKLRCSLIAPGSLVTRLLSYDRSHDQLLHAHLQDLPYVKQTQNTFSYQNL